MVADMAVTNKVTRADSVWAGTSGLLGLGGTPGYKGAGIGVAVIDSGIAPHSAIGTRVVARVNLVSNEPGVTGDPFGHGTHVAGMIGGANPKVTTRLHAAAAPRRSSSSTSACSAAPASATRATCSPASTGRSPIATKYGIRVINLSLGHPVAESAATDPLCLAVERAVKAGIVVVTSAGNYGLTSTGAPVLGGITSPGNSPAAITVGALDTKGTADRSDDVVAPYSSRGPTPIRPHGQARRRRARHAHRVARSRRLVPRRRPIRSGTSPAPATNGYLRLSGTSMADRRRQRRRRAAAERRSRR